MVLHQMDSPAEIDLAEKNSSEAEIARAVIERLGPGESVLGIGCGKLCSLFESRAYVVTQIDGVTSCGDIDWPGSNEHFDVVVWGGAFPQLRDPRAALQRAAKLLKPDGFVCVSVPNVAHGSVQLDLLRCQWKYEENTILDPASLRFFTADSFTEIAHDAGLEVQRIAATVADPLPGSSSTVPEEVVQYILNEDVAFDREYVFILGAKAGDGAGASMPDIVRLSSIARHASYGNDDYDQHVIRNLRRELRSLENERYQILTVRDYAIGMEKELGRVRYDLQQRDEIEHQLRMEIIQTHARLADALADAQRLRTNPVFRMRSAVGRVLRKAGLR
jgi:SAM-dependent methyltransferase